MCGLAQGPNSCLVHALLQINAGIKCPLARKRTVLRSLYPEIGGSVTWAGLLQWADVHQPRCMNVQVPVIELAVVYRDVG